MEAGGYIKFFEFIVCFYFRELGWPSGNIRQMHLKNIYQIIWIARCLLFSLFLHLPILFCF